MADAANADAATEADINADTGATDDSTTSYTYAAKSSSTSDVDTKSLFWTWYSLLLL